LRSNRNENIEKEFLIETCERIENMVNRENDLKIGDREQPNLLLFEPLSLLESATLGAMSILARLINHFPPLTLIAPFPNTAHRRRATIKNIIHHLRLLIRKPILFPVFGYMPAKNIRHIVSSLFSLRGCVDDFISLLILTGSSND